MLAPIGRRTSRTVRIKNCRGRKLGKSGQWFYRMARSPTAALRFCMWRTNLGKRLFRKKETATNLSESSQLRLNCVPARFAGHFARANGSDRD